MKPLLTIALTLLLGPLSAAQQPNPDRAAHVAALDIAPVWAGRPVGSSLV